MSKTGNPPHSPSAAKTNLTLLVGDAFLRKQRSKALVAAIEKEVGETLTRQKFDLAETPLETVLAAARTLPFLSSGQILEVQGAGSLKEKERLVLAAYLERSPAQTFLILEADEMKDKGELLKLVKGHGQAFLLSEEESRSTGTAFLQQKLSIYRKTMTPGAKAGLLAMCGDAVVFLDTMLDRLVQFAGDRNEIDETMVNTFEENWTSMDVFKLTNAFLDRDPGRILKIFRDLMDLYEADLISIVGILHWQLRQLWQAAVLLESGAPDREVCSKCRMPPQKLNALRKFPVRKLEAALEALYQVDKKSKTGQMEGVAGVEAWLLEYSS